jgi:hypothetical protein
VNVSLRFALAALRSAYTTASTANPVVALRVELLSRSNTIFETMAAGSVKSVSANGQMVTLADYSEGPTPTHIAEMWTFLVDLFDRSKSDLGGTPSDADVEAEMETHLRDVAGYQNDWSMLQAT